MDSVGKRHVSSLLHCRTVSATHCLSSVLHTSDLLHDDMSYERHVTESDTMSFLVGIYLG